MAIVQTAEQKARAAASLKANVAANKAKIADPTRTISKPSTVSAIGGTKTSPFERRGVTPGAQPVTQPVQTAQPISASDQAILDSQKAMYDKRTAELGRPKITAPEMLKTETTPSVTPTLTGDELQRYNITKKIMESQYKGLSPEELDYVTRQALNPAQNQLSQVEQTNEELLKAQRKAVADEEKRIAREEQRLADVRQGRAGTYADTLESKYDPLRTRAREQAKQNTSVQERLLGARGSLTSSTGEQALGEIDQSLTDTITSIEAAKQAEIMLYEAQLADADGETINAMRQNVANKRAQADQFEMDSISKLAELKMQAAQAGDEAMNKLLEDYSLRLGQGQLRKVNEDVTFLKNDGYAYDEYGRRIQDADGNDFTVNVAGAMLSDPASIQYVGAQYDSFGGLLQEAGYFNKRTGQFTTLGGGSMGGIPVEGGSTGVSAPGQSTITNFTAITSGSSIPPAKRSGANPNGLDLAGPKGTPIKANVGGTVLEAKNSSGWGNTVVIQDDNGVVHRFSHLDNLNVTPGMRVNPGALLGGMGNTGNVVKMGTGGTGTHLDYTVYGSPSDYKAGKSQPVTVAEQYAGIQSSGVVPREQRAQVAAEKGLEGEQYKQFMSTGLEPGLTKSQREAISKDNNTKFIQSAQALARTAEEYKNAVNKYGLSPIGEGRKTLQNIYADLKVKWKEAANLGALTGPDLGLLEDAIPNVINPLSAASAALIGGGKSGVVNAINTELNRIQRESQLRKTTLETTYPEAVGSDILNQLNISTPTITKSTTKTTSAPKAKQQAKFTGKTRNDAIKFLKANGYPATTANIDKILNIK